MPLYTFRILDSGGQTLDQSETDLTNDIAALQKGRQLRDGHTIKILRGDIVLAIVAPMGVPAN